MTAMLPPANSWLGNRAAVVVGARSVQFWAGVEQVRGDVRRAIIADAGYTPEDAPCALVLIADGAALRIIDLKFHDLRHEAGSRKVEDGWPLHHGKEVSGHANLKQTDTCLNPTAEGVRESQRQSDERRRCKRVANEPPTEQPCLQRQFTSEPEVLW